RRPDGTRGRCPRAGRGSCAARRGRLGARAPARSWDFSSAAIIWSNRGLVPTSIGDSDMRRPSLLLLAALVPAAAFAAPTKLLRFPDVHGDQVAFCYAGDIWKAPVKGGTAVRLTA